MKREMKRNLFNRKSAIAAGIVGAGTLMAGQALGLLGGGILFSGYVGELPDHWYEDEVCATEGITFTEDIVGNRQWEIKPAMLRDDGDPNTYVKCSLRDNNGVDDLFCNVGLPDGTVIGCGTQGGLHHLPHQEDTIYMLFEQEPSTECEIALGTGDAFGIADPKCRTPTSGSGGGGNNTPQTCDASTADAVLSHGQITTIPSDSCIQLANEPFWSSVNPQLHPASGTTSYPVPFTYTYCGGQGTGSLTGNDIKSYLIDGPFPGPNYGCDVFIQLEGNGSPVQFSYFQ